MNYQKSTYYDELKEILYNEIYNCNWKSLGDLNITFIELIKDYLKIPCNTYRASKLDIISEGNQKLIDICKHLGADSFIVKPGTEHYHPEEFFNKRGVELVPFEPQANIYNQQYGEFIPDLSARDYAMNYGQNKIIW